MPRRAHHSHDDVVGVLTDVPEEACLPQAEIDRAAVVSFAPRYNNNNTTHEHEVRYTTTGRGRHTWRKGRSAVRRVSRLERPLVRHVYVDKASSSSTSGSHTQSFQLRQSVNSAKIRDAHSTHTHTFSKNAIDQQY